MLADQGHELLCRDQKCNCVNKTEQPQNNKPRQPIIILPPVKSFSKKSLFVIGEAMMTPPGGGT
jgi:hypothetical protein